MKARFEVDGMVKTENLTINGKNFTRTYSDSGNMIERDGVRYSEAIDPAEFGRTYVETDEPVEIPDETAAKAAAYDILTGGAE
jgi:hypothetical protein